MSPSIPGRLHPVPEPASPVRWEPCLSACPDETGTGVCATCGWLVEDHGPDQSLLTPRAA
jgi:hypothetical protein